MRLTNKIVRQSVTLPANVATQVRTLAKSRQLSANRMIVDLIKNEIEAEKRKHKEFFGLAKRFRKCLQAERGEASWRSVRANGVRRVMTTGWSSRSEVCGC